MRNTIIVMASAVLVAAGVACMVGGIIPAGVLLFFPGVFALSGSL